MPPVLNSDACVGCSTCVQICPVDVFSFDENTKKPVIKYAEECWHCNSCVLDCPKHALSLRVPLPAMLLYVDAPK